MVAQFAQMAQMFGVIFLLFGESIFSGLGVPVPAAYDSVKENKMMVIGILFLANTFAQQLVATGAFEIQLNGQNVFSKLKEGRMPTIEELLSRLDAAGLSAGTN